MNELKKVRTLTLLVVVVGLAIGALWRLVPAPAGATDRLLYSPMGTPLTLVDLTFAVGSGLLFLWAVRNFKDELKPAYRFIASAQVAVGALTLFFPYIEYYDLWSNVWLNMASYLAYLIGSIFMYFGTRQFLKRVGKHSRLTSLPIMLGITLLAWGLHAVLPHNQTWVQFNPTQYNFFELVPIIPVIWYAAAAYNTFKIRRTIGKDYQRPFTWLTIGLSLQMFACITILVLDTFGYENWYFASRAYEVPNIVADMALLFAAYLFNSIGLAPASKSESVSSLDIVLYAADMVSDPPSIDPTLDRVRLITSREDTNAPLTAADQQVLREVYLEIEKHLVTYELLRKVTREELRQRIAEHFHLDGSTTTFWPQLSAKS
ncbi:MAG TPA: hypothetical protein VLI54_07205 [Bacillota bacterium]|nr:hypothetical protein [Bacillota bacterium]